MAASSRLRWAAACIARSTRPARSAVAKTFSAASSRAALGGYLLAQPGQIAV